MGEGQKLEFSTTLDAFQAATYLENIAKGLREGAVCLSLNGKALTLTPNELLKFELAAESEPAKSKGSLELELSWKVKKLIEAEGLMVTVGVIPTDMGVQETENEPEHEEELEDYHPAHESEDIEIELETEPEVVN